MRRWNLFALLRSEGLLLAGAWIVLAGLSSSVSAQSSSSDDDQKRASQSQEEKADRPRDESSQENAGKKAPHEDNDEKTGKPETDDSHAKTQFGHDTDPSDSKSDDSSQKKEGFDPTRAAPNRQSSHEDASSANSKDRESQKSHREKSHDHDRSTDSQSRSRSQKSYSDENAAAEDDSADHRQHDLSTDRRRAQAPGRSAHSDVDNQEQSIQHNQGARLGTSREHTRNQGDPNPEQSFRQRSSLAMLGLALREGRNGRLNVFRVDRDSLADRAGLQRGDEIESFGGRRITSQADLQRRISLARPGARIPLIVNREGEQETLYWTADSTEESSAFRRSEQPQAFLGVLLDPRYPQAAVVRDVYQNSPADEAGIRAGDVIVTIDDQPVRSPQELVQHISQLEPGSPLDIQVSRRETRTLEAELGDRSDVSRASFQQDEGDENAGGTQRFQSNEDEEERDSSASYHRADRDDDYEDANTSRHDEDNDNDSSE